MNNLLMNHDGVQHAGIKTETLQALEAKIDEMLDTCQKLRDENRNLRLEKSKLSLERDSLHEKNTLAKTQVESMIERLKLIEESAGEK